MSERRFLLVTGAGASHRLSLDPDEPLPLMVDWAERLRSKIGPMLSAMTGLDRAEDGTEFEETLGALFRWVDSLAEMERFSLMVREHPERSDSWPQHFEQSLTQGGRNAKLFQTRLHESLFEQFGPSMVDPTAACEAYTALFAALGVAPDGSLICATTNYDRSLEMALAESAGGVRTGFAPQSFTSSRLDPLDLGEFRSQGRPSLLYLHGAVGWYRQGSGAIVSMPADQGYNSTLGTPAVLYPSPDKDIDRSETTQLWTEFRRAVREATHIFVLGHALNDTHLVRELRASAAELAVSFLAPDAGASEAAHDQAKRAAAWIRHLLPDATPIGIDFGPEFYIDDGAVDEWRLPEVAARG